MVDAKTVGELRKLTGAGMMEAKKALEATGGDIEKATEELRTKGLLKATKRSDKDTKEGQVYSYIHSNKKLGAIVEIMCETDFVARNDSFTELCSDVAMHVAAADPKYINREDVPAEVVSKEKGLFVAEMKEQNKPADVIEKIVEGKMSKYFSEVCLMEQLFIKDDSKTVDELVKEKIASIGENIQIGRFTRIQLGG